ncbi:nitroreductase family protein [Desnuesiella massiliensis]|uniref:nitroreductase family protein n=1 Tax=Desnuesiella massiliensis TaxID=1650662 RepID=UPI0006E44C8C|nr:nitroreductase family protein [Desnuesiella massiliensis]
MNKDFYEVIKNRRTIYGISKESVISDERIEEIVNYAVKHVPSAFNSQSARVVLLLGENHNKLWDITKETLRKIVPEDSFAQTEARIDSFRSGYGSILYFEDQSVIKSLQEKFALYKDNFPVWSQQSSGMLQFAIWSAIEAEGLGASLQHYNPLIDDEVKNQWNIPSNWKLIAQMPFGKPTAPAGEKEFMSLEERVKIFK